MAGVTRATQVLKGSYPVKAPNIKKAKQLAAGHTGEGKVLMWSPNMGAGPLQSQVAQNNLKQIGIDVSIKLLPRAEQSVTARNRSEATYDINWSAWGAESNYSFDFINILLDGTTIGPTANNLDAYYNNAKFNKAMHKEPADHPRSRPERCVSGARRHHDEPGSAVGTDVQPPQSAFRLLPLGVLRLQPGDEPRLRCSLQEVAAGNASGRRGPSPRRPERGRSSPDKRTVTLS